jgi:ABC-2 type transport system permease protein
MAAVFKRDVLSYFRSMVGYIYLAGALIVAGYAFSINNIFGGSGSLKGVFDAFSVALTLAAPFLTAAIFVDGREVGFEQMLYTSARETVAAKFFAALFVMSSGVVLTWIYAGITSIYGEIYIPQVILCQIGLVLLSGCVSAMSMFMMSISNRKMQAFVMIFAFLMIFYVAANLISTAGGAYAGPLSMLGLFSQYDAFASGVFSLSAFIFMAAFIAVFLLATCLMLERRRERGV